MTRNNESKSSQVHQHDFLSWKCLIWHSDAVWDADCIASRQINQLIGSSSCQSFPNNQCCASERERKRAVPARLSAVIACCGVYTDKPCPLLDQVSQFWLLILIKLATLRPCQKASRNLKTTKRSKISTFYRVNLQFFDKTLKWGSVC